MEKEIGEIQIASGNLISSGALVTCAFNRIPVIIKTALGSPIGVFKCIDDYSHVETRCAQYACQNKMQSLTIPKEIVLNKIKGQNLVLKKYGLKQIDFLTLKKVNEIYDEAVEQFVNPTEKKFSTYVLNRFKSQFRYYEGTASMHYFREIFSLFPESFDLKNARNSKPMMV